MQGKRSAALLPRQQVWAPPIQLSRNPLMSSVFLPSAQMLPVLQDQIRCFQFFFLWQLLRSSSAVWRKPNTGNPFLSYDWTYCCRWRACQKAGIAQHVHWGTPASIAAGGRVVTVARWWLAVVGASEECEGSRVESLQERLQGTYCHCLLWLCSSWSVFSEVCCPYSMGEGAQPLGGWQQGLLLAK